MNILKEVNQTGQLILKQNFFKDTKKNHKNKQNEKESKT